MTLNGESWEHVESYYLWIACPYMSNSTVISKVDIMLLNQESLLDVVFYSGYGAPCPIQVKLWTSNFVYFSREYDGSDFISSIERHP